MKRSATLWAFAAMSFTAAQAEVADIRWSEAGEATREFRVAPGQFAEWCGKLKRGEKVQWRFESDAPMDFNVHYHEGKDVRFPAKQEGMARAEGTLDVAADQDYCWMWTNKSAAPAAVKAGLRRPR